MISQQERASVNTLNPIMYPPGYGMRMAAQEFCKLHKPKINKLKGGYSAITKLIFQSCIKDIRAHIEDQNLEERDSIQLVKDFTAEHAHSKVEVYMGMVVEDPQTFEGLVQLLKSAFQSEETVS